MRNRGNKEKEEYGFLESKTKKELKEAQDRENLDIMRAKKGGHCFSMEDMNRKVNL